MYIIRMQNYRVQREVKRRLVLFSNATIISISVYPRAEFLIFKSQPGFFVGNQAFTVIKICERLISEIYGRANLSAM